MAERGPRIAINAVFWPYVAVVTLNRWHSLEQGWNSIANIQAELLEEDRELD